MARAVLHFAPRDVRVSQHMFRDEQFARLAQTAFKEGKYERHPHAIDVPKPYPLENREEGEGVAEEIFDLTNNPSREEERAVRYGNGRSLSSGDIVEVEGGDKYLCLSTGWAKLA